MANKKAWNISQRGLLWNKDHANTKQFTVIWENFGHVIQNIIITLFSMCVFSGHLLYEMCVGAELDSAHPQPAHLSLCKNPDIISVSLNYVVCYLNAIIFVWVLTLHQHCKGYIATFQLYWWRKTSGAPSCIVSGMSGHLSRITDIP